MASIPAIVVIDQSNNPSVSQDWATGVGSTTLVNAAVGTIAGVTYQYIGLPIFDVDGTLRAGDVYSFLLDHYDGEGEYLGVGNPATDNDPANWSSDPAYGTHHFRMVVPPGNASGEPTSGFTKVFKDILIPIYGPTDKIRLRAFDSSAKRTDVTWDFQLVDASPRLEFANFAAAVRPGTVASPITSNLKKNTAFTGKGFFMRLANGNPATGLTLAGITKQRAIDAGAFATGTLTVDAEIGHGWYSCSGAAGDVNGNFLKFRFTEATCLDTTFEVVTDR